MFWFASIMQHVVDPIADRIRTTGDDLEGAVGLHSLSNGN
jgi:hypothetical protein